MKRLDHTTAVPSADLRVIFALVLITLASAACLTQGATPSLQEKAQSIDRSLMCPVCPAETIDQSQVPLAKQMRAMVREKLAAGESREEIQEFFVERYGQSVLAAPPKQGFNLLAWVLPGAGVAGALTLVVVVLRRMRGRAIGSPDSLENGEVVPEELAPYLARVDEDIRELIIRERDDTSSGD